MRIPRVFLAVLVALPLVVAGVFGWLRWDDQHLSADELHAEVAAARQELKRTWFRDHGVPTANDAVDDALDRAALRSQDPVAFSSFADFRTGPAGDGDRDGSQLFTYFYEISNEKNGGDTVCLVLEEQKNHGGEGFGLYGTSSHDGDCPETTH